MDAVKLPAGEFVRADAAGSLATAVEPGALTPRMLAAFETLLEAQDYGQDLGTGVWNFAVEIATLRRLKLSNGDLRWLVVQGFVEHAIEVKPRGADERRFRHGGRVLLSKRSCFALTPLGTGLARALRDAATAEQPESLLPVPERTPRDAAPPRAQAPSWDRDRRELRLGTALVKRFTVPSVDQESVLSVFEEYNWPARIEDPLTAPDDAARKKLLQETVRRLNQGQKRPLLRFVATDGEGIHWEIPADTRLHDP